MRKWLLPQTEEYGGMRNAATTGKPALLSFAMVVIAPLPACKVYPLLFVEWGPGIFKVRQGMGTKRPAQAPAGSVSQGRKQVQPSLPALLTGTPGVQK